MTDQLKKYVFNDHQSRVQAVKLTRSWQTGMEHQSYPDCVQRLLGELMSAAVLLAGNIKFDGSVVLQLQGEGAVALIVQDSWITRLTWKSALSSAAFALPAVETSAMSGSATAFAKRFIELIP